MYDPFAMFTCHVSDILGPANPPERVEVVQGSAAWLALRDRHYPASVWPSIFGATMPYHPTPNECWAQALTGTWRTSTPVPPALQRRYDWGHACEKAGRLALERVHGIKLPAICYRRDVAGLPLWASLDAYGVIDRRRWGFEFKAANIELRAAVAGRRIPGGHLPQLLGGCITAGLDVGCFAMVEAERGVDDYGEPACDEDGLPVAVVRDVVLVEYRPAASELAHAIRVLRAFDAAVKSRTPWWGPTRRILEAMHG